MHRLIELDRRHVDAQEQLAKMVVASMEDLEDIGMISEVPKGTY